MSSLNAKLAAVLGTVDRPGDFFTSGKAELLPPRLEVDGVGPIALPLLPSQAKQLVAVADRAPYGRGEATIVDTKVRRTWQIASDRVHIAGKRWQRTLSSIVGRATEGLGVSGSVMAELYKLLVYDRGSFFVSHRDTEKAPGMFATLVIALPSESAGGELIVRHKDRESRLDLRSEDPSEVAFAAFYADCVHEVLPVTDGCRLVLVYNLLRSGQGARPEPPSYEREQQKVAALLQAWATRKGSRDEPQPKKLVYLLEHAYTPAELGLDALKGADAAAASVLAAAAAGADCDLHLALLSIEETGTAEHVDDGRSHRRRWREPDDDEFEIGEILDRYIGLSEWRRAGPDGIAMPSRLPVDDDELVPADVLGGMEPDEQHFEEATGNEGATIERSYCRAALVLWPRRQLMAVLNQAGPRATLPYLNALAQQWAASDADERPAIWQQAHELSGHVLAGWLGHQWHPSDERQQTELAQLLSPLTRLGDKDRIEQVLNHVAGRGGLDKQDNDAIIDAVRLFPAAKRAALIESVVAGATATSPGACGALLARLAAADGGTLNLAGAAGRLVEALPGDPAREPTANHWGRRIEIASGCIADVTTALVEINEALTARAIDHMLAWPKTYGIDRVLIPAVRALTGNVVQRSAAVRRLRDTCLAHLRARIGEQLEPPRDWSRSGDLGCRCRHCTDLSRFLSDSGRKTWLLKAAEQDRSHVEHKIRHAQCDLDVRTDRHGRPYTLVCTKNQATYERRMRQREKDLENVARLAA
jgi:predicted 2-oxoglutarate/Fe(II)-dependent dioxygenase YbiX